MRVSAGLIFNESGDFLVAERAYGKLAGKWEFPGGKIEEGETAEMAIVREIKEELGVDIRPEKIVGVFSLPAVAQESEGGYAYPEKEIELVLIQCSLFPNQKIISDGSHTEHAWIQFSECEKYDFAPLDREIIDYLQKR
jgi:8-oxo-dGTP diphosphatase